MLLSEIYAKSQSTSNILYSDNAPIKGVRSLPGVKEAPSISFEQDTDTGMFNVSSNVLGFAAGAYTTLIASSSNLQANTQITTSSNIVPLNDNVSQLGTVTKKFAKLYATDIYGTSATFNTLGGTAISSIVTSTSSNVAASSAAVKSAYDIAVSASSQNGIGALDSNGDILLSGNLRISEIANIYKGTEVYKPWGKPKMPIFPKNSSLGMFTIMISPTGRIITCGDNSYGQLGNNTTSTGATTTLQPISSNGSLNGKTIVDIAGGFGHTLALDSTGRVHAWGINTRGQLGNNTNNNSSVPIDVSSFGSLVGKTIVAISGGQSHTLALDSTGRVHAWGYNSQGQLGNNTNNNSSVPIDVSSFGSLVGKTIVAISGGRSHTLALDSTGRVHAWGYNAQGQLGNNTTSVSLVPIDVSSFGSLVGKTIVVIKGCGFGHTIALDSTGRVHTWGYNLHGQLGRNNTTQSNVPLYVSSFGSLVGKTIVAIYGGGHTLALDSTGRVHAWGYNAQGQLGNNTTSVSLVPIDVSSFGSLVGKTIVAIAGGGDHTLALDSTGRVHAWGRNDYGQLGRNNTTNSSVPVLAFTDVTEELSSLFVNFTGQHRCFVEGLAPARLRDHEGLVVVTDKNAYASGLLRGRQRAMTINQALPIVSLSKVPKDPRAFGVISLTQEHPSGPSASISAAELRKIAEQGDVRVQINSLGEGCIWVCDETGSTIHAGDYVTTSSLSGYASLQVLDDGDVLDGTLRNYTVAKLTMDCDFSQPLVDVEEVQKDEYGNVVFDADGSLVYTIVTTTHGPSVVDPDTGETRTGEPLETPIPVTEPAYEMRWMTTEIDASSGVSITTLISKEDYEVRKSDGQLVGLSRASFVGCTYHCG